MSLNSFFVDSSGSLFFISGSYELSSSISTSLESDPETGSLLITQSFITTAFPDPSTNAFATFKLDPNDPTSFMITGSNISASFYMSSSGRVGFGTDDPLVAFDVRADEFQIQKQTKRQGVRVNEEGNLESFNSEADAAATGSEFILTYAVGGASKVTSAFLQSLGFGSDDITAAGGATAFFNSRGRREQQKILFLLEKQSGLLGVASVGDVLGSIRWVAASGSSDTFDKRVAGEAGNIKLTVASADSTGVTGKLSINLPADPTAASQELYSINGATQIHNFTGSIFFRDDVTFNSTNLNLKKDTAKLRFGADNDTSFTHVHNSGLTLNADRSIFFRDAAIGVSSQTDGFLELKADKGIELTTSITASSHISASGNIYANRFGNNLEILDSSNTTTLSIDSAAAEGNSAFILAIDGTAKISLNKDAVATQFSGDTVFDSSMTVTDITASGNISASGFISASSFSGDGSGLTNVTATATIPAGTISSSLQNLGNITGSNISASGTVTVGSLVSKGNVTATGTLSGNVTVGAEQTLELREAGTINFSATQKKAIIEGAGSNLDIGAHELRAATFESDIATGTAPFTIASNTQVANLHAATASLARETETYYTWEATTRVDSDDDNNWQGPNSKGVLTMEDWNQDYGTDYNDNSSTNAESRLYMNTGWWVPHGANYSASIKSMDIYVQPNSNITHADADTFSASLWYSHNSDLQGELNVPDANSGTFIQRHAATVDSNQCKASDEKFFKYNNYHVSQSINLDLAPGSMVFPRMKTLGTNNFNMNVYWVINYCKKPL